MSLGTADLEIPPLPSGVKLDQVYADFLCYALRSTKKFFENTTPNGPSIWNRLQDSIVIILATPNGWDTTQHGFLRTAAIRGGLLSNEDADTRLEFVRESEALVHFTLAYDPNEA
jgi:hypothetical protein